MRVGSSAVSEIAIGTLHSRTRLASVSDSHPARPHQIGVRPRGGGIPAVPGAGRCARADQAHSSHPLASAVSPDLVVEAIEVPGRFAIGVQWHPELLAGPEHLKLNRALVDRARARGQEAS